MDHFLTSRPIQMEPSGSIAKFLPQIFREKSGKNTFACHSITKERGGDTSKLFHSFSAAAATAVVLAAVEIFWTFHSSQKHKKYLDRQE